jgi:hypothetical protein
MSVLKMDYYTIECDNCKKVYIDDHNGYSAWADESDAFENASNDNWIEEEGNHYCNECWSYDDEDNLIIKKPIAQ